MSERDLQIISMRNNGYTFAEISSKYDISPQRVQQICKCPGAKRKHSFGADISNSLYLLLKRNGINNLLELKEWMCIHELTEMKGVGDKKADELFHLATN